MNDFKGKFVADKNKMSKYLILTNANEVVRIAPERIAYIAAEGNYSSMVLIDSEKHVFSFNLSAFEKILAEQLDETQTLIRLGRRLIVNGQYIYYVNVSRQQIILSDSSFSTKFTLKASKEVLRALKTILEDE